MKMALVTQRVDAHAGRGERRDALDQRLYRFLRACGVLPVPAPNDAALAGELWRRLRPGALVLSGGNDLAELGGDAPERDATEAALVGLARQEGVPVLGICRGMQHLVHLGGGALRILPGHAGTRHSLSGSAGRVVNSFHSWGVASLGAGWEPLGLAEDGSVESARCPELRWWGVMWHPEREEPFPAEDMAFVRKALGLDREGE